MGFVPIILICLLNLCNQTFATIRDVYWGTTNTNLGKSVACDLHQGGIIFMTVCLLVHLQDYINATGWNFIKKQKTGLSPT